MRATVLELTEVMNGLPAADELPHPSVSNDHDQQCDLHRYCICLEVALDEAAKWARRIDELAKTVAQREAVMFEPSRPDADEPPELWA